MKLFLLLIEKSFKLNKLQDLIKCKLFKIKTRKKKPKLILKLKLLRKRSLEVKNLKLLK